MRIKVIRDYCGEEGTGPDKDVLAGQEFTVTRERGAALYANNLVEILEDDADPVLSDELRTNGPTVEEFVAAGYPALNYPPHGYLSRSTDDEIAAAIAAQATKEDDVEGKQIAPIVNKAQPAPRNKAAPKSKDKAPAADLGGAGN